MATAAYRKNINMKVVIAKIVGLIALCLFPLNHYTFHVATASKVSSHLPKTSETFLRNDVPNAERNTRATSATTISSSVIGINNLITIPLISHSVILQRRLDAAGTTTSLPKTQRPPYSKYHLLRELQSSSASSAGDDNTNVVVSTTAAQIAGLFQGYGTHYADLWCGTPPQRQTVIVDTGSGVTAFPCNECKSCGVSDYHIDTLYDETASSSFTKLTCTECFRGTCNRYKDECTLGMSYQEGSSWNAFEASDLCYVGGFHDRPVQKDDQNPDDLDPFHAPAFAFPMKFGCQTHLEGLFITQLADGIMGMDVATAAFWSQMFDAKRITAKAFSLCYSRKDDADRKGTESGAMSLGGTDTRLHDTPLVYTPFESTNGFYVVHIRKIYLRAGGGGLSALSKDASIQVLQVDVDENTLNMGHVIVDSGTTVRVQSSCGIRWTTSFLLILILFRIHTFLVALVTPFATPISN
jgi:hypothetical protein